MNAKFKKGDLFFTNISNICGYGYDEKEIIINDELFGKVKPKPLSDESILIALINIGDNLYKELSTGMIIPIDKKLIDATSLSYSKE